MMNETRDHDTRASDSGSNYSTAFGFYSHIHGSADPRTGMYSASVELPTGLGNRLRGPQFTFRLAYSSLYNGDDGFGKGWRLGVTSLDLKGQILTLDDGESQRIERPSGGGYYRFPDRKLDSCRLFIASDKATATVEHATGMVEHLTEFRYSPDVLRTQHLTQPNGDSIHFEWALEEGLFVLKRVVDDDQSVLLEVEYGRSVMLSIATGARTRLDIEFIRGTQLQKIEIAAIERSNPRKSIRPNDVASWRFGYRNTLDPGNSTMLLLESLESPDGMSEFVRYSEKALTMPPGAPRSHMPAVASLTRKTITDGSIVFDQHFDWPVNAANFYGYPAVRNWQDAQDQLLHMDGDDAFVYRSSEVQKDASGNELCTIDRTYNKFHLVTEETSRRGSVCQRTTMVHGDDNHLPFDLQAKSFQLPRTITTSVWHASNPSVIQSTIVENTYDDEGNQLSQTNSATGITEVSTYYPVEGELPSCPPDPPGMVRRLKSRCIVPAGDDVPSTTTRHSYCLLPIHAGKRALVVDRDHYVQACGEEFSVDGVVVIEETRELFDSVADDRHGTVRASTRIQDGLAQTMVYDQTYDETGATITIATTRTTHDVPAIVNTSMETRHLVSGLVSNAVDSFGNRTAYSYDALARVVRQVHLAGEQGYEATVGFRYQLSNTERWVERTGSTGLRHHTWMDEQGRVTREEEPADASGRLMTVREATYDRFGQLATDVVYDVLGEQALKLETTYIYDDWGQPCRIQSPDGSVTVSDRALVEVDGEVMTRTRQWTETADGTPVGGMQTADTDAAGRQRKVTVGSMESGTYEVAAAGEWAYDGLGRCITQTDAMGQVTRQTWDAFDRLVTTELPDGDNVSREYAPGQDGELLAKISMTPKGGERIELGTREYDGLGRLTKEVAGSLVHRSEYVEGQVNASVVTLPGGGKLKRTYDRKLGEALLEEVLDDSSVSIRRATYDKILGLPTTVDAEAGRMTIHTDFLGRMTEQDIDIGDGHTRRATSIVSPGGIERERIGVDGMTQSFDYDDRGRCIRVTDKSGTDEHVTVTYEYDEVSRVAARSTRDASGKRSVTQRMTYDALGRIRRTTFRHEDDGTVFERALTLAYRKDNKIEAKTWADVATGEVLRAESMTYDVRGRLVEHDIVANVEYPTDDEGRPFRRQVFTYGAIDNLIDVETTPDKGPVTLTTYTYDPIDRDRVVGLRTTVEGAPEQTRERVLLYDASGHLTDDGQGHTLTWDRAGRLRSVTLGGNGATLGYRYGPDGRVASVTREGKTTFRYHIDGAIYCEFTDDEERRYIRAGGAVVAETLLSNAIRKTWLLGSDPQGSILTESVAEAAP